MLFPVIQNKSVEFQKHLIRQELETFGFLESAILLDDEEMPCGVFALSGIQEDAPSGWAIMRRISNGYVFHTTYPVILTALEGLRDLQTVNGLPLSPSAFTEGVTAFQLVRSDAGLEEVMLRIIMQRPRRYPIPTYADLMAKFAKPDPGDPLPLMINEVRLTGRAVMVMALAPGYRLRVKLAHTDAEVQVDFQPLVDTPIPDLREGDCVYVSGELAESRVIAFEVQKLISS